jgi:hypothetical protein
MSYAAELHIDHPRLSLTDQVDALWKRHVISSLDTRALLSTIAAERGQLEDPSTAALVLTLDDGRQVRVSKYVPPAGDEGRVRIEKRTYSSPAEEWNARLALLRQTFPSLSEGQRQARLAKEAPDLWEAHVAVQRKGDVPPPVAKAAAPSRDAILKMADDLVAEGKAGTKKAALAHLVQEHPDERAYNDTYRWYHLGPGMDEHLMGGSR